MVSQVAVFAAFVALFSVANGDGYDYHHAPQPYSFGYNVKDHHSQQHRQESGDGHGNVKGSYGFTDAHGIYRQVNYVADHGGFRASVKTNEPGTSNQDPAAVNMVSAAPYAGAVGSGYGAARLGYDLGYDGYGDGLGYEGLGGYGRGVYNLGNGGVVYGLGNGGLGYDGYGRGYGAGRYGMGY